MKNRTSAAALVRLDKRMFEAGQQCLKRLYLDQHEPLEAAPGPTRTANSEAGQRLLEKARSAFPRGILVAGKTMEQRAARTAELLATDDVVVLFGAAFVTDETEVTTDILLRQKSGELDLFEVKSGTRVKPRHLGDLALQTLTIERCGYTVRAAHVLHASRTYVHVEGDDLPSTKLLRSADVTARVRRQLPTVTEQVKLYRQQLHDESALQLPTGSFCTQPFTCPHLETCQLKEPAHPLRQLPELQRQTEQELHEEGIDSIAEIDPERPGLTYRQRRTVQAVIEDRAIIEPFVRDELRTVDYPLHFLAILDFTEALPRWPGTRPWQPVPHAWAVRSIHEDGHVEDRAFRSVSKDDPRQAFVESLSAQLASGGTVLCWGCDSLNAVRNLLDSLPEHKQHVRAILGRHSLDLARLLESGLFHPQLPATRDLETMARVILEREDFEALALRDGDDVFGAILKALQPRVRATTREKIAGDLEALVVWQVDVLCALYEHFADLPRKLTGDAEPSTDKAPKKTPRKRLPPQ